MPKRKRGLSCTKKAAFTLLEVLVVLFILSSVASVVGWQINKCISRYALQSEVEELYFALRHCQILALTYQTDIALYFLQDKEALYYQFATDEPFSDLLFDRKRHFLKHVGKMTLNGKSLKNVAFSLYSNGDLSPRGMLGFYPHKSEEDESLWIDFQGAFALTLASRKPALLQEKSPAFPKKSPEAVLKE
ncbi:MAG TPA: type II secretion system protein [Rhabdochlamydiaceae bacterium]|jgi:prepilin-type N-terminal cleavage/methylation domain-containing protein